MKKTGLSLLLTLAVCTALMAQDQQPPADQGAKKGFDRSRIFIGGNFGLSFGSYTLINISPQVGYRFNDYFAGGVGINAIYSSEKYSYGERIKLGIAGMNIFGRFYPIQQVFAQLQPEMNYIWGSREYSGTKNSLNGKILPSLLAGVGGVVPMGRSGGLVIMGQYDILNKSYTYPNPGTPYGKNIFFSVGFNVGL